MRFFGNRMEPFGLPKGTIRATVVLIFAGAVIFPLIRFSAFHQDIPQSVKEVVIFLAGALVPVILKYFDSREKDDELEDLKGEVARLIQRDVEAGVGPLPSSPKKKGS